MNQLDIQDDYGESLANCIDGIEAKVAIEFIDGVPVYTLAECDRMITHWFRCGFIGGVVTCVGFALTMWIMFGKF